MPNEHLLGIGWCGPSLFHISVVFSCFLMYGSVFHVCILKDMSVRIISGAKAG